MRKLNVGFVVLFLLHLGISAPVNSLGAAKASSSKAPSAQPSLAAASSPQALGDQIAKFLGGKTGQELMAEKVGGLAAAGVSATPSFSGKSSASTKNIAPLKPKSVLPASLSSRHATRSVMKPGYVPPPPVGRVSVPQIRQEIQKILDLNKKIKHIQGGSPAQFQRVQEQARIHQKILNELEASQKNASAQQVPSRNVLLAQEKLRIIHEETQHNATMLAGQKRAPVKTIPKEALNAKTSVS